jgi:hypothetical protein
MARTAASQFVEVPIAEEGVHSSWQQIDFSNESCVLDDDYRIRKTVSSAFQFQCDNGIHVVYWYVNACLTACKSSISVCKIFTFDSSPLALIHDFILEVDPRPH